MIQIPGYRILRELGRGGMATVYLAVQESVAREVALKVMSPVLLADHTFSGRFMREARIAANLHHRNVVGVYDVGCHADRYYIAMEYLARGPVMGTNSEPIDVLTALRVIREIAGALAYAHAKGYIHRDIKPDNILLRDDGSAALTDFGIARALDNATRMTRTGSVIGTPHYMSPEQARGREIDGRADLYSLGVVFHELLLGKVPYSADDSLAVGIMHITEPVPTLPAALAPLQPLLAKMMAKSPEERYQTGFELVADVEAMEYAIAKGKYPGLAIPDEAYRRQLLAAETRPAATRVTPTSAPPRGREEPSIGRMEGLRLASPRPAPVRRDTPRPASSARSWIAMLMVGVLAGAAAGGWTFRAELGEMMRSDPVADLLPRIDTALATGQLDGETGNSARELLQAAQTLAPADPRVIERQRMTGRALLDAARRDFSAGQRDQARTAVTAARALLGDVPELITLNEEIEGAQRSAESVAGLLDEADAALASNRLSGDPLAAAALYQRVLEKDPGNGRALTGIERVADRHVERARAALVADDFAGTETEIDAARALSPQHAEIAVLQSELAEAREARARGIDQLVSEGEALVRSRAYIRPEGANALEKFRAALARDPTHAGARQGLRLVAKGLAARADEALDARDGNEAAGLIEQIRALAPDLAELRSLDSRLREQREREAIASERVALGPGELQKVANLLQQARAAEEADQLMSPPGECAYDRYRSVLALDRGNAEAKAGLDRLGERVKSKLEAELANGSVVRAHAYFDGLGTLRPRDPMLVSARPALASGYVRLAEQETLASRFERAQRYLDEARRLGADSAELSRVQDLLQMARASAG